MKQRMALSGDSRETMEIWLQSDPAFAKALMHEVVALRRNGEPETAERVLRDLATSGSCWQHQANRVKGIGQGVAKMSETNQLKIKAVAAPLMMEWE